MTAQIDQLIDDYLDAYSEVDPKRRASAVSRIWAADGRLVDPPLESQGHAGIAGQVQALLSQFPDHRFRRSTGIDAHHGFARYGWQLVNPAGETTLEGCDFAEVDGSGRLQRVVGFFGPIP